MNNNNKITLKETIKVLVKDETMLNHGYKLMAKRLLLSIIIPALIFIKIILKLVVGIFSVFIGSDRGREIRKRNEKDERKQQEFNRQMDSIKYAIYYKDW